jgi:hypothetical protein
LKPATQEKSKAAAAEFIRAMIASPWFWERLPVTRSANVRKERSRLQRAAVKAKNDPVRFAESLLGASFFAVDSNLRESAATALCEAIVEIAQCIQFPAALTNFVASKQSERRIVSLMRKFFVSMASRPGRPQQDKYRNAAAFLVQNSKTPLHRLCLLFEPGYSSMDRKQQEKARKKMYAGVNRVLKQAATRSDEIPLSVS